MGVKSAGLLSLAIVVLAAGLYSKFFSGTPSSTIETSAENSVSVEVPVEAEPETVEAVVTNESEPITIATSQQISTVESAELDPLIAAEREQFYNRFDLSVIGNETLDDEEFSALVAFLKNDPVLFAEFLLLYRETADPDKARRLAQVLDEFDDATITNLAEGMVFSGDVGSQVAGLDLLSGQQTDNPQAREIVSQILEIETNSEVISAALNALATPADVSPEDRDNLLNQFVMHSSNDDAAVRRRSMSLMKRWAGDNNMNEHYIAGLQDSSENVRIGAVLSLATTKHRDDNTLQALVGVVEDLTVDKQSRQTAMVALQKYDLPDYEKQRLQDILAGN